MLFLSLYQVIVLMVFHAKTLAWRVLQQEDFGFTQTTVTNQMDGPGGHHGQEILTSF